MVIIMDMHTGKRYEEPADPYGEEVLNANWLPQPALQVALQAVEDAAAPPAIAAEDAEAFLAAVYRYQE